MLLAMGSICHLNWQNTIQSTLAHLGYNDVSFPQSQIAVAKLSLYPESFTEGTGLIDFKGWNHGKEDILVSRIVLTRVDCSYCPSEDLYLSNPLFFSRYVPTFVVALWRKKQAHFSFFLALWD